MKCSVLLVDHRSLQVNSTLTMRTFQRRRLPFVSNAEELIRKFFRVILANPSFRFFGYFLLTPPE